MDRRQCEGRRHLITLPFLILHLLFIADQAYTSSSSSSLPPPPPPSSSLLPPSSSSSLQHKSEVLSKHWYNTVLDPQHNTVIDPQHNTVIDPQHNTVLYPQHNTVIDPQHNTVIDPQHNTVLYPQHNTVIDPQHNTVIDPQHTNDTTATTNTDNNKAEVHDDLEIKTTTENTNKKSDLKVHEDSEPNTNYKTDSEVHKDLKLKDATANTSTQTILKVHKDLEPKTNKKTDSEVHKDLELKDVTANTSTQTDSKVHKDLEPKTNKKTDSEVFYEDSEPTNITTEPTTTMIDSEDYDDLESNELEDRRRRSLDDNDDDGIHLRQSREKTYVPFNSLTFMTDSASSSSSSSDVNWVPTDRVKVKQQVENSKLGGRKPVSSTIRPVVTTLTTFPYVVHNWKTSQGQSHPITAATDVTEASAQVTETTTNSATGFTEDFTDLTDFFIQADGEYGQRTQPGYPFHNTGVTFTGTEISTTPPPTFPDGDTTATEQQSTYNPPFLPTVLLPDPQDAIDTGQDTSSIWSGTLSEHSSSSTGHSNPTHIQQQRISEESEFSTQQTTTGILSTNWEPLYETDDNTQQIPWEATPQVLSDSGSVPRWTAGIFEVQGTTLEESGLVTWIPEVTDFLSPEQTATTIHTTSLKQNHNFTHFHEETHKHATPDTHSNSKHATSDTHSNSKHATPDTHSNNKHATPDTHSNNKHATPDTHSNNKHSSINYTNTSSYLDSNLHNIASSSSSSRLGLSYNNKDKGSCIPSNSTPSSSSSFHIKTPDFELGVLIVRARDFYSSVAPN
ncbi:hypothetical protein Pcinc_035086 [Petrolisthes cinctipes]|uniref:Uncharacterized protein n=1 Tax=Petrolisthes cinctipes TaxID=88211 RepID=A0AAE1BZ08_PETCI|nr:hypothetical protein Pcinc_035086 [Petrolisthes cinctipes]